MVETFARGHASRGAISPRFAIEPARQELCLHGLDYTVPDRREPKSLAVRTDKSDKSMVNNFSSAVVTTLVLSSCASAAQSPTGPSGPTPVSTPADWNSHTDATFGFAVAYPPAFVILPEPALPTPTRPPAVLRVRFQEKSIAAGQFAELEPARFMIQIFEKPASVSLDDWLRSANLVPAGATSSPIRVEGARESLRVALRQQIAPNEFVYVAGEAHVYRLTPLGEHGAQMRASFRVIGAR